MIRTILSILWLVISWPAAFVIRNKKFEEKYNITRKCVNVFFKIAKAPVVVHGISYHENTPILFVSNHQGTLDPLVIVDAISTPMTFISKEENKKFPIISSWAKSLELIYFNRSQQDSAVKMLRETSRTLKSGKSVLVFPEGTRAKCNKMADFHAASLKPAYLAKASIVPVTLHDSFEDFNNIKNKKGFTVTVGNLLTFEDYKQMDINDLAKTLHDIIEKPLLF